MTARYTPGLGFVRTEADPLLDCSALDPDTHELWLLQMPVDVRALLQCFASIRKAPLAACQQF